MTASPAFEPPAVLMVEDDDNLRLGLRDNLLAQGYVVVATRSVPEAEAAMAARTFSLLLLDVMLPGEDGYGFCRRLRASGVTTPVMMLTARSLEEDVVRGFEAGAQDYLTKPYRVRELLARVKALVQRPGPGVVDCFRLEDMTVDLARRTVMRGDIGIPLTRTELDLLGFLLRNPDRARTREEILDMVWGRDVVVDLRTVDNFVSSVKRKLGWSSRSSWVIHTLRGVGYRMEPG